MEIKVGDYVRTDIGEIGKLEDLKLEYTKGKRLVTYYTYREVKENLVVFDNKNITQRFVDGSSIYLTDDELKNVEDSIVKSSPNIIDLIEVGDYVNGCYVTNRQASHNEGIAIIPKRIGIIKCNAYFNQGNYNDCDFKWIEEKDIKSIVTKEQFAQMEYKIHD